MDSYSIITKIVCTTTVPEETGEDGGTKRRTRNARRREHSTMCERRASYNWTQRAPCQASKARDELRVNYSQVSSRNRHTFQTTCSVCRRVHSTRGAPCEAECETSSRHYSSTRDAGRALCARVLLSAQLRMCVRIHACDCSARHMTSRRHHLLTHHLLECTRALCGRAARVRCAVAMISTPISEHVHMCTYEMLTLLFRA